MLPGKQRELYSRGGFFSQYSPDRAQLEDLVHLQLLADHNSSLISGKKCLKGMNVTAQVPIVSRTNPSAANRMTVAGVACRFPALYNGQATFDCVSINGREYCQARQNNACEAAPNVVSRL